MESSELVQDGLISVAQAARFLSVSRSTMYKLMDSGNIRYLKVGRARRVPRKALIDFVAGNMVGDWHLTVPVSPTLEKAS
jgi:excisionase family DNA binding protein